METNIEASYFPRIQTSAFGPLTRGSMETCDNEEIRDLSDQSSQQFFSTSAILNYCQQKMILPYTRLLGLLGLRPLIRDFNEPNITYSTINKIHLIFVSCFLIYGYIMQNFTCYRRDTGFSYVFTSKTNLSNFGAFLASSITENSTSATCEGNLFFCYIFPQLLHFFAYMYSIYQLRMTENEHLQTLFEKVFLLSSRSRGTLTQRTLLRSLRIHVVVSVLWLLWTLIAQLFVATMSSIRIVSFLPSLNLTTRNTLIAIMVASTFCQDVVHCLVTSNYCIECQLLMSYIQSISDRIIDKSLSLEIAMKELLEYDKFLVYLNDNVAPAIGMLLMLSSTRAIVTVLTVVQAGFFGTKVDAHSFVIIMFAVQWLFITLVPFIFAAFVTATSRSIRSLGQKIRVRPFGYQDTSTQLLDSFMTFTASQKGSAKLFFVPITAGGIGAITSLGALIFVICTQFS